MKKVLGLDIGSNSIGFSLLNLTEINSQIKFEELVSNSIIFSEPNTAEERREARGARRLHRRKSRRNRLAREIFVKYSLTSKNFIEDTTNHLNSFTLKDNDVYNIRERAMLGEEISQEEFTLATYSIITDRGYNNMFTTIQDDDSKDEDGAINEAVSHNKKLYKENAYLLPSMVLTTQREALKDRYQNIAIRNKKGDYSNSLDREMHKEEFKKVALSQANNKKLFKTAKECEAFVNEILDETITNRPFFQRPLRSFEGMVEYCSFYDEFHPKGSQKRMPLANVVNIELTIRQSIDNYNAINKNGETKAFTEDEKDMIVHFWLNSPNVDKINNKNIYKNAGFKDVKIHIGDEKELIILNIQAHRSILQILNDYKVEFATKDNDFYNDILLELYYYKNASSRKEHIEKIILKYNLDLDDNFTKELASLKHMDGFASFSLKFASEVIEQMRDGKIHSEALEKLGYKDKYLKMPRYDYLPPLAPSKADIVWLTENIKNFNVEHLYYQPMMSPQVKRVIAILRKLINKLTAKYGKIDEIRIETARELNSKKEQEKISKNQGEFKKKNSDAEKYLTNKELDTSSKNIERAKLFKEQECECLYCDKNLTEEEAFDENSTEIEHFIPRSVIWINSQKNKILVHKKCNQNKGSQHPISYLKSIGEWENFKGRIKLQHKSPKYKWLTDEETINSAMNKENWQDKYLNDTRSATRSIQKYLNHYLYPNTNRYGKGEDTHIFAVTGKAVSELKYMWGIHKVMPKNSDEKKDRNTNYHHTLDAFAVALCSNSAIQTLHNHFKQNENKFKTKAQKEKLQESIPTSTDGTSVGKHLQNLVEKYETNQLYVCPYNKRKTNMKGFKDGNLKLYVSKDPKDESKEILAEMEKVAIDSSLLIKKVNGFDKDRNDKEVKKEIVSIQSRLNPQKQQNIIDAIKVYADELLALRALISEECKEISKLDKKKKTGIKNKDENAKIQEEIEPYKEKKQKLSKELNILKCSFTVKGGKQQIVRSLKLHKVKITKTSADSILYSQREERTLERLSVANFKSAIKDKEPFVVKDNESTLCVELYAHPKQNQVVGLKYFSSIANPHIKTKINEKYGDYFDDKNPSLTLYKNDILKVHNLKDNSVEYFIFNGGGLVAGSNNKVSIKNINHNSFRKIDKNGEFKESKEGAFTPNKSTIVSKVKIDFFGNITEDKPNENKKPL